MTLFLIQTIGFLAATATVAAFSCRQMISLRIAALIANGLFIAYAVLLSLMPILALHCVLLPLNIARLVKAVKDGRRRGADQPDPLPRGAGRPS